VTAPLRIGVLGCAQFALRRMIPALNVAAEFELSAVASRDPRRAADTARPYGCRAVHGYRELLADSSLDAVYVPLPAALHDRWTEAALDSGKHVLAEKPLTTSPGRTAHLLDLARSHGLALMENVLFVHHSQHHTVRELIEAGTIGELRALQAEFTVPRRHDDDIRHDPDLGGGALWDTAVYPVRAALHFLGPHLSVVGAVRSSGHGLCVDTAGSALLRTPYGVTAQLTFGLDHGYRSRYEIIGSRGRISVDRAFTPPADHTPVLRVEHDTTTRDLSVRPCDQVSAALKAFAAAARAGVGPDQGVCLRQAELLHDIAAASPAW
jgi:dTDP-3,4-didehydro-2,6-dideoxy-alpha-D-glucose 3-reductase